jgi:hypothetical protein
MWTATLGAHAAPTSRHRQSLLPASPYLKTHHHRSGGCVPVRRERDTLRHFGDRPKGHDGPVQRAVFVFLIPIVATVSIGYDSYALSGATTAHSPQFCRAMKPAVLAGQRLPAILAGMSSHSPSETKGQLLTGINSTLNALQSVRVQLRSAPANVRSALNRDISAEARFKTALSHATTKRQIRRAALESVGSLAQVGPFIFYVLTHCEGSARSGNPATP